MEKEESVSGTVEEIVWPPSRGANATPLASFHDELAHVLRSVLLLLARFVANGMPLNFRTRASDAEKRALEALDGMLRLENTPSLLPLQLLHLRQVEGETRLTFTVPRATVLPGVRVVVSLARAPRPVRAAADGEGREKQEEEGKEGGEEEEDNPRDAQWEHYWQRAPSHILADVLVQAILVFAPLLAHHEGMEGRAPVRQIARARGPGYLAVLGDGRGEGRRSGSPSWGRHVFTPDEEVLALPALVPAHQDAARFVAHVLDTWADEQPGAAETLDLMDANSPSRDGIRRRLVTALLDEHVSDGAASYDWTVRPRYDRVLDVGEWPRPWTLLQSADEIRPLWWPRGDRSSPASPDTLYHLQPEAIERFSLDARSLARGVTSGAL